MTIPPPKKSIDEDGCCDSLHFLMIIICLDFTLEGRRGRGGMKEFPGLAKNRSRSYPLE